MRKFLAALLTLCLALTLVAPIAMAEEKVTITPSGIPIRNPA